MRAPMNIPQPDDELAKHRLIIRMGAAHARHRFGQEQQNEARRASKGRKPLHLANWALTPNFITTCLRVSGLFHRGQRNSRRLNLRFHRFHLPNLPAAFDGFRILHLTDLHVDMDPLNLQAVINRILPLEYDLCVLTGDYRRRTWGPIKPALEGMARLREAIKGDALAVLGNHDSIYMVPPLEQMGYQLLLNEHSAIERDGERLYVAGVDDAHFFKTHNLHQAGNAIPAGAASILLSHTPEIWREAAHTGYSLFLCGHTHGGQICLPGGIPVTLDSDCPRALGRGFWRYNNMQGYTSAGAGTSVVNVRLNCPPEVTVHTLHRSAG